MRNPTRSFTHSSRRTDDAKQRFYHPELDVLRFVALLGVFMHHALPRDARLYTGSGLSPTVTEWILAAK